MNLSATATLLAALFGSHPSHQAHALPSYASGEGNSGGDVTLTDADGWTPSWNGWSNQKCQRMKRGLTKPDAIKRIACPAMRFLTREGLLNDVFENCGFSGIDVYGVDAASMKSLITSGTENYPGLGFDKVMTKKNGDGTLDKSVCDRCFAGAIDGQAGETGVGPILNVDQLEMNFDHSASSGIIGTATRNDNDNDAVNWDKYYEFLDKMCNCDSRWRWNFDPFSPEDIGRAVNHFGAAIEDEEIRKSTDVGAFSWGILSFEWANTFAAFQKDGKLPYSTFKALFEASGTNAAASAVNRDIITEPFWLGDIICAMNIQISPTVEQAMIDELAEHDCSSPDSSRADLQCKISGLLTDICGDGYANCLEGDHPNCEEAIEAGDAVEQALTMKTIRG